MKNLIAIIIFIPSIILAQTERIIIQGFYGYQEIYDIDKKTNQKNGIYLKRLNGTLIEDIQFKNNIRIGKWKFYGMDNQPNLIYDYDSNKVLLYDFDTSKIISTSWNDSIAINFNRPPVLFGSMNEMEQNILYYPPDAAENGVSGEVKIGFTIDNKGIPTNFRIIQSAGKILDNSLLNALTKLNMNWLPALKNGIPVKCDVFVRVKYISK